MRTRDLGTASGVGERKGGPAVSVIGYGAWPLSNNMGAVSERDAAASVEESLARGVTFFDTAEVYGPSEERLGPLLRPHRDQIFLATKVSGSNLSAEHVREAVETSLRRLQTDVLDLYQIHWFDGRQPLEEGLEEMAALQAEGKIRYLGLSNFDVSQMERALQVAPIQSLQPRYNMFDREIETAILPFCREQGIGILAHSPLAKGLLAGKYRPGHAFPEDDERSRFDRFQGERFAGYIAKADRLKAIAEARGLTLPQLAVAWTLREEAVTVCLVGAKDAKQARENAAAGDIVLTAEEVRKIEGVLAEQ
jgi:aryl-alcohol dehydrogenase-like predicted oxidoreductase